jgi:hypothetical protein
MVSTPLVGASRIFVCGVPLCVCGLACWCFCSWRLCLWVVVCHPVGSSAPCFSCFVASCSSVCCSCFVSVLSVLCCVPVCYCVSSDLSVFVSVCVYCCDSLFSSWCCSSLLSVAVCLDLFSVHVVVGLWVKCCSGVLPPCLFTSDPFLLVFVLCFLFFR